MPVMQVYKSGEQIAEKVFEGQFSIVEKDGELHWLADDDPGPGRGQVLIWVVGGGEWEHEVKSVGPDWRLTVDGTPMARGIYLDLYVSGKTVELARGNYRFVCVFPPHAGEKIVRSEVDRPFIFVPASSS